MNPTTTRPGSQPMTPVPITVVARFRAKRGMENRLRQELIALVEPTRREPGCINYDLHQDRDDPVQFLFYENWTSGSTHRAESLLGLLTHLLTG